jgi:hypothetical protein
MVDTLIAFAVPKEQQKFGSVSSVKVLPAQSTLETQTARPPPDPFLSFGQTLQI